MKHAILLALIVPPWGTLAAIGLYHLRRKTRSRHWRRYVRTLRAAR